MLYAEKKIKQCSVFFQDLYSLSTPPTIIIHDLLSFRIGEGFKIRYFFLSLLLIFVFY